MSKRIGRWSYRCEKKVEAGKLYIEEFIADISIEPNTSEVILSERDIEYGSDELSVVYGGGELILASYYSPDFLSEGSFFERGEFLQENPTVVDVKVTGHDAIRYDDMRSYRMLFHDSFEGAFLTADDVVISGISKVGGFSFEERFDLSRFEMAKDFALGISEDRRQALVEAGGCLEGSVAITYKRFDPLHPFRVN